MISGIRLRITVGTLDFYRSPKTWIESRRHACLDRAGVTLPDPEGTLATTIKIGDPVTIEYGYRDQEPATWSGTVVWTKPGTIDQIELGAAGLSKPLADTKVTQAWMDETPEAILRFAIGQAGLSVAKLDAPGITFPRFVASNMSPWDIALTAAATCQRSHGRDMSRWALWLGSDGVHWGDHDQAGSVPVISTAAGLIAHNPASDRAALSRIESFLLPGLVHSQLVHLVDDRRGVDQQFRALSIRHELAGVNRTYIEYGEEHPRL